jgi:alcohol dehydrogenase class IV
MRGFIRCATPGLVFGSGSVGRIPDLVAELGSDGGMPVLVLSDPGVSRTGLPGRIAAAIAAGGVPCRLLDTVPPEPTDVDLDGMVDSLRGNRIGLIVAVGGGSVIDAAKILSVLVCQGGSTRALADNGVTARGLPCIAVPTTAGTGAEATPNAIVMFPEHNLKVGIVSRYFLPDRVVLDPELSISLPPGLSASTGLDALCHLLECFISKKANPYSDMHAREGLRLVAGSLRPACRDGADIEARSAMLLAAYYGGMCIAASGTTAVHALSYPLGGRYRIPHGIANAALLVPVMVAQVDSISGRLAEVARIMGLAATGTLPGVTSADQVPTRNGTDTAMDGTAAIDRCDAQALVAGLRSLVADLGVPTSLADLGIPAGDIPELAEAAYGVRRLLDNNPVELDRGDIRRIYESMVP